MDVRETVQAYFERLNAGQFDAMAELFHPEAELAAPGFGRRRGRKAVAAYFRQALSIYPEHYDDPVRVVVSDSGETATVNIHYEGKLANGHPLSFDAVDVFDFKDGLIVEETSWYDSHWVRGALLEGRARDDGRQGERARLRLALAELKGRPHAIGGRWTNAGAGQALCLPAFLLDVEGELTEERAEQAPRGWALLVRGAEAIGAAALEGRPAGGCSGELLPGAVANADGAPWAVELRLDGIEAGPGALVSAPGPDGAANAIFIA